MKLYRMIQSSLKIKMLLMFVILSSLPLILIGILSYYKSFETISSYSKAANALVADRLRQDIDTLFHNSNKLLDLENNATVRRFLFSQSETYADAKEILRTFQLYRETYNFNESVLNITMVNLYGKGISERKGVFQLEYDPLKDIHFNQLMVAPGKPIYVPPSAQASSHRIDGADYHGRSVISIISTVKQPITHQVIGFIVIDLDDMVIEQFCNNVQIGKSGYFYVVDEKGSPIFLPVHSDRQLSSPLIPTLEELSVSTGQYVQNSQFIVHTASEVTGWSIIGQVPLEEVVHEATNIRKLIFVSVTLSILFIVSLYFFITSRLTRPIGLLKNKMRQAASGFLEAKVHMTGHDEIADLGKSFNIMLGKIKTLLQQSIEEQEHIKKAELRTLQAQINPHFLYNTLDSILWMAESGRNDKVILLVKALSQFFRIGLNKGKDWITLREELEHVRSYLTIQQMRYSDILTYEIEVPHELLNTRILKMSLQPLVENALYHGIKNKRGVGLLSISGTLLENNVILLLVKDNGIGITEERLKEVRASLQQNVPESGDTISQEQRGGFGIRNVYQRLSLYYKEPFGMQIDSEYRKGTTVSLRIPFMEE